MAERRAVRATTRQGKQASAPAAGHRRRPVFREGGGPHRSEAWRLSASALWLPEEMILKIVEINLQQATQLPERLGVARLSSVCKAWDAALLPLFHPGVPGVISPAELRKIKRLALDQTNYSPLSDRPLSSQLETLNAHIEATERFFRRSPTDGSLPRRPQHGFLLPERMLPVRGMAENRCTQNRHTFLTDAFVSAVMGHMNDAVTWFNAPVLHQYRKIVCLLTDVFSPQSRLDHLLDALYTGDWAVGNNVLHFNRTACLAYRMLMVIKAVEARAMAMDETQTAEMKISRPAHEPTGPASSPHRLLGSTRAHRVPLTAWRENSPPGLLARLAWDAHRESSASYSRMSRAMLNGSPATRMPIPPDADPSPTVTFGQPVPGLWIQRKARELFPLFFLATPPDKSLVPPPSNYRDPVMDPPLDSGLCTTFRAAAKRLPAPVCDIEAALVAGMPELLGRAPGEDEGDEEEEGEEDEEGSYSGDSFMEGSYSGDSFMDSELYSDMYDSDGYSSYYGYGSEEEDYITGGYHVHF